jgi:hypothetical protein
MRIVPNAGALLASLGLLSGTTLQQLSMDDMIRKSTEIVRGKVHCTGAALRGSTVYTSYRVQVSEQWKGAPSAQIDFAVPGGSSNGIRQTYAGAPSMDDGQDLVLFLWTSKSGLRQVIGLSQGLFNLTQTSNGQIFVTRGAATETMVGLNGQPVLDADFSMPLSDLRMRVANTLTGRSQ